MWPLVAGVAAAAVTALGIAAARRRSEATERATPFILALASGVLVAGALVHLLPHALEARSDAPLWTLAGFGLFVVLDRFGHPPTASARRADPSAVGWTPVAGIALHSFLDGLTYTAAFEAGGVSGWTVASGMILHELPEGVIVYALLLSLGLAPRRAALVAWIAAGLTTPLGVLLALPLLGALSPALTGLLTALVGGVLLHVGASHLWPRAAPSRYAVVAFGIGAGVALATRALEHA